MPNNKDHRNHPEEDGSPAGYLDSGKELPPDQPVSPRGYGNGGKAELGGNGFDRLVILYRETADGIEVVRVLHTSRDIAALLRGNPV